MTAMARDTKGLPLGSGGVNDSVMLLVFVVPYGLVVFLGVPARLKPYVMARQAVEDE